MLAQEDTRDPTLEHIPNPMSKFSFHCKKISERKQALGHLGLGLLWCLEPQEPLRNWSSHQAGQEEACHCQEHNDAPYGIRPETGEGDGNGWEGEG